VRQRIEALLARHDDVATPENLRALRGVEVLERISTSEARELLRELAGGAPGAFLTLQARAAFARAERNRPRP
jgi:hypothetical protein